MGFLFPQPSIPAPPPPPPPPPAPPSQAAAATTAQAAAERAALAGAAGAGFADTILTSPQGVTAQPSTAKPGLIGSGTSGGP